MIDSSLSTVEVKSKKLSRFGSGLELTRNCKNFLSWAGELFIIPHVHKTSKDATPPLQGKRKRVQVHECKSRRRASLEEISNATDEGTNGKTDTSEASRIVLVARIAANFLKSIADINALSLVTQVPVKERC